MPDYYTREAREAIARITRRTGETRTQIVNRAVIALDQAERDAEQGADDA